MTTNSQAVTGAEQPSSRYTIRLRRPHPRQREFIASRAKRKVIRAGRRGGKTVGVAQLAIRAFLEGKRVLYAVPTQEQVDRFWFEVKRALSEPLDAKVLYKNETEHVIEVPDTLQRIRAKTAWNADTLRGDYADLLILDEYQLMSEDAWEIVGAPMMLDHDGDAVFVYTPPSARSRGAVKARDKLHAAKLFKRARADTTGRWATFHFTSHDNPHLSKAALAEITQDMTALAIAQEIMAEDRDDAPGALWQREMLDKCRVTRVPNLARIVVAIDPAVTSTAASDETGIVVAGVGPCNCKGVTETHGFVLDDKSLTASPSGWATQAVAALRARNGDRIIGETNNGGEMIESTLRVVDAQVPYKAVHASRGKYARAEPIAAQYEQGRVHHVGVFGELEDQLCNWVPASGTESPDRLDALVWALTELMLADAPSSSGAMGYI